MQEESVKFLPLSIGKLIYYLKHGYYHSKKVQVQQDTIGLFSLFICKEKIIIKKYKQMNESNNKVSYIMRIWKTTSFLNYFYTDFPYITNNEFIALIEYSFEDNSVRIDNIVINDSDYAALMRNTEYLNHYISHQLKIALLSYVIDIAVKNNKNPKNINIIPIINGKLL